MKQPALWIFAAMSLCGQNSSDVKIDGPQARVRVVTEQPHQPIAGHDGSLNRILVYIDSGQMIDRPIRIVEVELKKHFARGASFSAIDPVKADPERFARMNQ